MKRLLAMLAGAFVLPLHAAGDAPRIVTLTQVACQFLESEGGRNLGYRATKAADCEEINARTAKQRLSQANPLQLAPGKYVFRVTNRDVPYPLGFWLRGASLVERARLPSVSGGGLAAGATLDYAVELKPGRYVFSCPLNPTPDYALIVK